MLTLKRINQYYDDHQTLCNVSLTISNGSCFGLVGPNGAGKSTLIKIIASIIHDYDGQVQFSNSTRQEIGYVPQEICLEETVSASDNLIFFGKINGLSGKSLQNRVDEVLSETGLAEREKDKVMTFSSGMKRRLNIGCAIMHNPMIMIMDEPTVGIDPQSRRYIFQMIEQFKQCDRTIIYASHYMEEVEQLCDEVAFIDQGSIVEHGSVNNLLQHYSVPSIYMKGEHCLPDDMSHYGFVTSQDDGFIITTSDPMGVMENIISYCRKQNGQLDRLELVKPRLEDVFFSLTGSQLRD